VIRALNHGFMNLINQLDRIKCSISCLDIGVLVRRNQTGLIFPIGAVHRKRLCCHTAVCSKFLELWVYVGLGAVPHRTRSLRLAWTLLNTACFIGSY
jgi:hypothetical protein